ncbi:Oidioi.mRNA.OKI2018_I69.chr2.g4427.t2.cds [Oikopleura dioica]|uniref:Oidioi.mRNA.OKI2018_I69.chr2.g4427.t2.cds n=1 Tax=Oikopleura dioica TaxID=34765 RepID=A0ABN7T150_OIKDI|nr:Oidioi.mRNA.OKI2018_I69.chr2.g4427.t2.cds [Oikopleura dioica]
MLILIVSLIGCIFGQKIPKQYQKICNDRTCKTCDKYLVNLIIKKNNDDKILSFCTGILQAEIPTDNGKVMCCHHNDHGIQFGFAEDLCNSKVEQEEESKIMSLIGETCPGGDCNDLLLENSETNDRNTNNIRFAANKCFEKESAKMIKVLYFLGIGMMAFACVALFMAYSRHRAPDFRAYQSEIVKQNEKMLCNRDLEKSEGFGDPKPAKSSRPSGQRDEPKQWACRLSNSSESLRSLP